ncbi:MAG: phospholipase D-like domain-containing protein [Nitrospirota bacterium]|jgi:cardiolipin synthase
MESITRLTEYWPHLVGTVTVTLDLVTAAHILLRKEDTRAAVGWLGLVWLAPLVGALMYWTFGVNRIKRRARLLFAQRMPVTLPECNAAVAPAALHEILPTDRRHLAHLAELTERVTSQPLVAGNRIIPLVNGDAAYPAMLEAIRDARRSVSLTTYIFDNDRWGRRFRTALRDARRRGVEVRVLIDAVGARYSFPPVAWGLRRDKTPVARFMRSFMPWRFRYFNLRSHRKILVVDGRLGFTGGMNIRAGAVLEEGPRHPVQDLHFRVQGPVVAELQRAFADDWLFTTGEALGGDRWFPELAPVGQAVARGISDGPDEDFDKLRFAILGALACAHRCIRIQTPYFLPDSDLVTGLRVAALRGATVEILLPERGNLRMVQWASTAGLGELLNSGCRVFLAPPPFDHSKALVVDDAWTLLGSANWDPRSLVLNFEFNVECYDPEVATAVTRLFEEKRVASRELKLAELAARPLAVHLRDRAFRLFSPYL